MGVSPHMSTTFTTLAAAARLMEEEGIGFDFAGPLPAAIIAILIGLMRS